MIYHFHYIKYSRSRAQPPMLPEPDPKPPRGMLANNLEPKSQSVTSSVPEDRSEEQLYFSKYFLHDCFKILHIDIAGTQEVSLSLARHDSYMIYLIRVLTEEFSYEIRRRYSEFLNLYHTIAGFQDLRSRCERGPSFEQPNVEKLQKQPYTFPTKKLSSSLLTFFNKTNKQKLAQQRKAQLCLFLNQVVHNYQRNHDAFVEDYIELLRFIDMKEEHQKYWRRKEGRYLELSNLALKDTNVVNNNIVNCNKGNQKQQQPQINMEHLSQLLQHQMNKINVAITTQESFNRASHNPSSTGSIPAEDPTIPNDPIVTNQIIKNVDSIKDIVLEIRRKINYEHIRCILKGKAMNQDPNALTKTKKGLIEYCLKYASNELVTMHIIKTILNTFLNSEYNYSSDAFMKVLAEMDLGAFSLTQQREQAMLEHRELRELYFKLVKQYAVAREQFSNDRRHHSEQAVGDKIMGTALVGLFRDWDQAGQKNREFKLKDDQKQWTMVIESYPRKYSPRKHDYEPQTRQRIEQKSKPLESPHTFSYSKHTPTLSLCLHTSQGEEQCRYVLSGTLHSRSYRECIEIMKDEMKWNPLLVRSQVDVYSHTRKDIIKIPGKQEKMFRFAESEEIEMLLGDDEEGGSLIENYVPLGGEEEGTETGYDHAKNPKMSTQTMPSSNGSCAYKHQPEPALKESPGQITDTLAWEQLLLKKSPPSEPSINSYSQLVKIEKLGNHPHHGTPQCGIVIQLVFTQAVAIKYFASEVEGTTMFLWDGFMKAFGEQASDQQKQVSAVG